MTRRTRFLQKFLRFAVPATLVFVVLFYWLDYRAGRVFADPSALIASYRRAENLEHDIHITATAVHENDSRMIDYILQRRRIVVDFSYPDRTFSYMSQGGRYDVYVGVLTYRFANHEM